MSVRSLESSAPSAPTMTAASSALFAVRASAVFSPAGENATPGPPTASAVVGAPCFVASPCTAAEATLATQLLGASTASCSRELTAATVPAASSVHPSITSEIIATRWLRSVSDATHCRHWDRGVSDESTWLCDTLVLSVTERCDSPGRRTSGTANASEGCWCCTPIVQLGSRPRPAGCTLAAEHFRVASRSSDRTASASAVGPLCAR
mmetsp:Transcript_36814/g.113598  ORF Transcript_36814/g.113598 Transcript_36814/m.113598 type:complete len:208 (+) Transcript_36814:287-910(+)